MCQLIKLYYAVPTIVESGQLNTTSTETILSVPGSSNKWTSKILQKMKEAG